MKELIEKYKKIFPEIKRFYEYQTKSIEHLLSKKNCLTIAPTGGGKSLIYHLVGLELNTTTLVISPLKALMNEQVNDLKKRNIPALSLTSDISFQKQRELLRELEQKDFKFIYVSPERLQNYFFRAAILHSKKKIGLIVIDEAHCVSQWGFNFRPEYSEIRFFINFLTSNNFTPNVCALTATLSEKATKDIINEFNIDFVETGGVKSLIRPELKLNVMNVSDKLIKWQKIIEFIEKHKSTKVLIYFYSKKKCEELSKKFNETQPIKNLKADFFHADVDGLDKLYKYEAFKKGGINILFATTAFGMGMNIPDIDAIIQYHLPKSIEEYYQQVGRGARRTDLCPECNCLIFWSDDNVRSNVKEIKQGRYTEVIIRQGYEHFGLTGNKGKVSSLSYSEYQNAKINLGKLKSYFEQLGILRFEGEINGGPETIRFLNDQEKWNAIKNNAIANSFIIASNRLKIPVQDIINYVYDQDLKGNVEFIPAKDRKLFFKEMRDAPLTEEEIQYIIEDVNKKVDYQLGRFEELVKFCQSDDTSKFLTNTFKTNILYKSNPFLKKL
jgi:ATP-dependent DNA helicase RecQ